MKKIKSLLNETLVWKKVYVNGNCYYVSDKYPFEECYLEMNDFPDEPMWTLFYNGESIDFDDAPRNWTIIYLEN